MDGGSIYLFSGSWVAWMQMQLQYRIVLYRSCEEADDMYQYDTRVGEEDRTKVIKQ